MGDLDREMNSILSNPNLPADLKLNQYRQVFNRYQQLRTDFQKPPLPEPMAPPPPAAPADNTHSQTYSELPLLSNVSTLQPCPVSA